MENQTDKAKEPINNEGNQQAEQNQNPILLTTIGRVTTNTPAFAISQVSLKVLPKLALNHSFNSTKNNSRYGEGVSFI